MPPPNDDRTLPPPDHTSDYHPNPADAPTLAPVASRTGPAGPVTIPGYEIVGELGRGGMGVVYKAVHTRLHRPVALKMVLSAEHAAPRELIRFLAEAEAVAAIKHPHVVQVYEFGEAAGRPFFAMEYLPGGSLADRVENGGPLPPREAAELVRKLAGGVQAAHDLGIVHRDLKPANVLFDERGEPKVTDFGLAKRGSHDLTRTGAVMGTPAYMSPEQAAGRTKFVGPAADVYALGVILFECLTGRPPFQADDAVGLIAQVADDPPPPVRRFARGVPKDLDRIVRKCLAKEPHERYAAAADLAEDLERVAVGEPPRHLRVGPWGRIASSLGHGRQAAEFARHANLCLWLAAVVFLTDVVITLSMNGYLPAAAAYACAVVRTIGLPALVAVYRRGRLLPETAGERFMWSLWGGLLFAAVATWAYQQIGPEGASPSRFYPQIAILCAIPFFALGAAHWGWFYAVGAGFSVLPFVMALDPRFAQLVFGTYWAVVLVAFSRHLRRLAALAAPPAVQPSR